MNDLKADIGPTIRSLLAHCNVPYEAAPLDEALYQDCINEAIRRGYPVDETPSIKTYLRDGIFYASPAGAHLPDRKTQVWLGLFSSCMIFVDDTARFPAELVNMYQFNHRLLMKQDQGTRLLQAFADILYQIPELCQPVPANLIMTSVLNYITANLLECETQSMKISKDAEQFPAYKRMMDGVTEAFSFLAFPREVPIVEYIQAIPEMVHFANQMNDVLSFYKEELQGDDTNQISSLAAVSGKSKLEILRGMAEAGGKSYERIIRLLEGSTNALEAFKRFSAAWIGFHTSAKRYRLAELSL